MFAVTHLKNIFVRINRLDPVALRRYMSSASAAGASPTSARAAAGSSPMARIGRARCGVVCAAGRPPDAKSSLLCL